MTKAELVSKIAKRTGVDKLTVQSIVETGMVVIKKSLKEGENVYLRTFGSFIIKTRAPKLARNITKNVSMRIGEHKIPAFKPCRTFSRQVSGEEFLKADTKK